jgi:hypothetical protein
MNFQSLWPTVTINHGYFSSPVQIPSFGVVRLAGLFWMVEEDPVSQAKFRSAGGHAAAGNGFG